ncbi:coxsackievirus and adenovirus receptor homolog [Heptranchias perlo]|uniref:coxsackievirus and adenovirus receptor homolog n=1 Tax=Heptranchias perlo TaxID=212740 RepID=UPI003559EFF1
MMHEIYILPAIFLCFTAAPPDTTAETKNYSTIWKQAGDNVTLPCKYRWRSDQNSNLDIEWMIKSTDINKTDKMIATFSGGKVYTYSDLQQEISFSSENGSGGDTSLHIESLAVADSGIYHCKVKKEGTIYQEILNLTVHGNQKVTQLISVTPTKLVNPTEATVIYPPKNDGTYIFLKRARNRVAILVGVIIFLLVIQYLRHRTNTCTQVPFCQV